MVALRWVIFGMALAAFLLFAVPNWGTVVVVKLGAWELLIQLPVLLLAAFLLGLLPMWLTHVAVRSGWRRRLARAEKAVTGGVVHPDKPVRPAAAGPQPSIVPPAGA